MYYVHVVCSDDSASRKQPIKIFIQSIKKKEKPMDPVSVFTTGNYHCKPLMTMTTEKSWQQGIRVTRLRCVQPNNCDTFPGDSD